MCVRERRQPQLWQRGWNERGLSAAAAVRAELCRSPGGLQQHQPQNGDASRLPPRAPSALLFAQVQWRARDATTLLCCFNHCNGMTGTCVRCSGEPPSPRQALQTHHVHAGGAASSTVNTLSTSQSTSRGALPRPDVFRASGKLVSTTPCSSGGIWAVDRWMKGKSKVENNAKPGLCVS